ncbi:YggS family pyridoxal phosphate-dependent enzyme [bacterium]|nr:YggS family pyridoxal phosphate-dependent enzyme [bacterium]
MSLSIRDNLLNIQKEIAHYTPNIIAVTKYFGTEEMLKAYEAGLRDFGESRANEAIEKITELPSYVRENSKFHFIGHLQTNKAEKVVKYFDYIHSVDSLKLALVISEAAKKSGKKQKILLQLNNANEEQKFGYSKEDLLNDFPHIINLDGVEVVGLMNIAPLTESESELNRLFSEVREFKTNLETEFNFPMKELSMGMSNDYKIAAANGATMIRIGRKLFSY